MAIDQWGRWDGKPDAGTPMLQGSFGGANVQANAGNLRVIQGSAPQLQAPNTGTGDQRFTPPATLGAATQTERTGFVSPEDQAAAAAAAKAAEDRAKADRLRGETTELINRIKQSFSSRYGLVDAAAAEQSGMLDKRFANESKDITEQINSENNALGAAHAASGTFDSSYRGNNVDTVTKAGEGQIRDLGDELRENKGKIGSWAQSKKAGYDAETGKVDAVLRRLGETTDLAELTQLRSALEAREAELKAGDPEVNTVAQGVATLSKIAPSNARAVQLKTTLSSIVAGGADKGTKSKIGERLIASAGLDPEEAEQLRQGFMGDLATAEKKNQA